MAEAPHIAHHDQSSNGHQNARSSIEKEELEALPGTRRLFDSEGHVTVVLNFAGDASSLKKHGDPFSILVQVKCRIVSKR